MNIRKIIPLFVALAVLLALTACGPSLDDSASPKTMLDAGLNAIGMSGRGITYYSETSDEGDRLDDDILSGKFGELLDCPTVSMMKSYALFFSFDTYGAEAGVFCMNTNEDAAKMKTYIENRQKKLLDNAVNYPELDTATVSSLTVKTEGCWVYFVMSEANDKVTAEFERYLYK